MIRNLPWWLPQLVGWQVIVASGLVHGVPGVLLDVVGVALLWFGWRIAVRGWCAMSFRYTSRHGPDRR
jgi:hypothetical protein